MARKTAPHRAPKTIRNGLKWRDGRPRWEPSPASRALGLRGVDLKDLAGRWIADRGLAISICDGRHAWAAAIREAAAGGPDGEAAGAKLRQAMEALAQPSDDDKRLRRLLIQDLVHFAGALLNGQDTAAGVAMARAPRTVERLLDAYFDAVDAGRVTVKPATRKAYSAQRARFLARFAGRGVASIRRMELKDWYHDELLVHASVATANLAIGAAAAWLAYAQDLEWIAASPAHRLDLKKAAGRRVFWTLEEETAFVAFCDSHGFEDVADAAVMGLWTGARPIDMCAADLDQLAGEVWRFTPIKTEAKGQEAMPAITPPLRARLERRRLAAHADTVRHLAGATPVLWQPGAQRRHDTKTLWTRYCAARAQAIAADAVPETFAGKRLQDTRDTCITRLFEADVAPARMWTWTGHSQSSIEAILKEHYLVLRQEGQMDMARKLEAWAKREALKL